MNYQYNQQPQPQPQPGFDQNPVATRRKVALQEMADKMAAFFGTNGFLNVLARGSHVVTYIVTGLGFLIAVIDLFLGVSSVPLGVIALMFGVLSVSKRTTLPLAVALTYVSLFELIMMIFSLVTLINLSNAYTMDMGYALSLVFGFIIGLVEFALLAVSTVISWMYFAASLPPKMSQPQPYGQVPPQGYNGQVPPQQYGQQVPPQQFNQQVPPPQPAYQQPPVPPVPPQPAAPVPPQQPAAAVQPKVCPSCGTANDPAAITCKSCGVPI